MTLSNNSPIELSREHAEIVKDILARDMGQAIRLLEMVQEGRLAESAAVKVVSVSETMRPVLASLRRRCGSHERKQLTTQRHGIIVRV